MASHELPPETRLKPGTWRIAPVREIALPQIGVVELRPLAAIHADLMAEFFAALTPREIYYFFALRADAARRLALGAASDPAYRLIALASGDAPRVLGYMFLDWGDGAVPTFGACLHHDAQSGGLGRTMMEHLLSSAQASGVERARLTVHADNWRALRLYQRTGFRIVGEQILESQGAKQYQMDADFQAPIPPLSDSLTIVARGGLGVGVAAAKIQDAIERRTGTRPCIVDRPFRVTDPTITVVDLAAPAERPFDMPAPPLEEAVPQAWITTLDADHLLIGGIGAAAVNRAADAYVRLLADSPPASKPTIPIAGLHIVC